jgi:hypothetical protein
MPNQTSWLKIRNPRYSQWVGREKLFEKERKSDPEVGWSVSLWRVCTVACKESEGFLDHESAI